MKEKKLLIFPAELISHKTYATKHNVTLVFELQENLVPEELAQLLSAKGKTGHLVFNPTTDQRLEIDDIPTSKLETDTKTPSQRLRNVLYVFWKQNKNTTPFDTFYAAQMERMIDRVKAKLEPE